MFCLKRGVCSVRLVLRHYYCSDTTSRSPTSIVPVEENETSKSCINSNIFLANTTNVSDILPAFQESYNVAAFVNKSEILQSLVKMNVDLSHIEKKPHLMNKLLQCDVQNISKLVFFLLNYMEISDISKIFTKNPGILQESLDDLNTRINYLHSKKFTQVQINRILTRNPFWLMYSTLRIDRRLGFFQEYFGLKGYEVRSLSSQYPKLITYNLHHVKVNTFSFKEEMGFNDEEIKYFLLSKPKFWTLSNRHIIERFNYLHNTIGISHQMLLKSPEVLSCRKFKLKQRHEFLEKLGRAQYDPSKENYVPISALALGTDIDFCKDYAKSNVHDFNLFLKTQC